MQLQLHYIITLHHNYNSTNYTTATTTAALHHTTSSSCEVTDPVTTATIGPL